MNPTPVSDFPLKSLLFVYFKWISRQAVSFYKNIFGMICLNDCSLGENFDLFDFLKPCDDGKIYKIVMVFRLFQLCSKQGKHINWQR